MLNKEVFSFHKAKKATLWNYLAGSLGVYKEREGGP